MTFCHNCAKEFEDEDYGVKQGMGSYHVYFCTYECWDEWIGKRPERHSMSYVYDAIREAREKKAQGEK